MSAKMTNMVKTAHMVGVAMLIMQNSPFATE